MLRSKGDLLAEVGTRGSALLCHLQEWTPAGFKVPGTKVPCTKVKGAKVPGTKVTKCQVPNYQVPKYQVVPIEGIRKTDKAVPYCVICYFKVPSKAYKHPTVTTVQPVHTVQSAHCAHCAACPTQSV